ncbi:NUDIX hydrolase [Streptomyces sp. AN091965]|uniref:NUDIX hydrolase n=1 Tax=Streptomyces sp. AN091965 TaxID=2927803 RepID=UPI0035A86A8C
MTALPTPEPIRAAGCVLWRRRTVPEGLEICLVHRPKYDDWSHPKGKLKPGETPLACALREVEEETGHRCVPGPPLPSAHYTVGGRPKCVDYWSAEAADGCFRPGREVDRIRWLTPHEARARLTQLRDRELLDAFLAAPHTPGAR